ncbi:ATP-binding cassette domain-containing protein [Pigmentiphaga sp. H8]|uniref:ABC transporter ATP-binding protein n=1 Tax=Pigmentiphaga sp. H8 TaxID=2488560 RepID=UPI000F5AA275|nr:ATP-binding cassette domain-containing protein [Pigmentiphaga sp. H8]AZG06421.1 ATP-binding cassette domain-containing protein [Pigmentiphaga sp. H8]
MIRIARLCKTFNANTPDAKTATRDLDLSVADGEFVAVIGGNGAGKSTLLNLVAGALLPDSGTIEIAGKDVTRSPEHRRSRCVARVFQDPMTGTAPMLSVEENLVLAEMRARGRGWRQALTGRRRDRYREALAGLGLGLEDRLGARAGLLSGGQRQALALVMATLEAPQVLLLDEHTAALDPRTSAAVMEATRHLVAALRLTTLMVTHNMEHALQYGSRIVMMADGAVRADLSAADKQGLSVADLVERFHIADDRMMLS